MPYTSTTPKQGFVNAKTGASWPMRLKDADMERILERLDRLIRDVVPVIEDIEKRLGVEEEGEMGVMFSYAYPLCGCLNTLLTLLAESGEDTDEEDSQEESKQ